MKSIIISFITLFFILGCNANISDVSELGSSSANTNTSEKRLSSPSTVVSQEADTNVRVSVIKDGSKLNLGSKDKVVFELDHSVVEIVNVARISERKSSCPSSIKEISVLEDDNYFILCNSYIKRSSLTDVFFEINGKKIVAKSWVFSNQDEELIDLQINL